MSVSVYDCTHHDTNTHNNMGIFAVDNYSVIL